MKTHSIRMLIKDELYGKVAEKDQLIEHISLELFGTW